MEQDLIQFAIFASILSPILVATTEVVKRAISKTPTNLLPLLSVVIGIALAAVATPFTDLSIGWRLWGGFLAGLSSCGLYDIGKFTIQKKL